MNKTETRVELRWSPSQSSCLDEALRQRILLRLKNRMDSQGTLSLVSEKYRSQVRNKEEVFERFIQLVHLALLPPRKRIATRTPRRMKEERLRQKKLRGDLKLSRRRPGREE